MYTSRAQHLSYCTLYVALCQVSPIYICVHILRDKTRSLPGLDLPFSRARHRVISISRKDWNVCIYKNVPSLPLSLSLWNYLVYICRLLSLRVDKTPRFALTKRRCIKSNVAEHGRKAFDVCVCRNGATFTSENGSWRSLPDDTDLCLDVFCQVRSSDLRGRFCCFFYRRLIESERRRSKFR